MNAFEKKNQKEILKLLRKALKELERLTRSVRDLEARVFITQK